MRKQLWVLLGTVVSLGGGALGACSGDNTGLIGSDGGADGALPQADGAGPLVDSAGGGTDTSIPPGDSGGGDTTVTPGPDAGDSSAADTNVGDTHVADSNASDTNVADTNVADTNVADTNVADTNVADTNVPDTNAPDANSSVCNSSFTNAGAIPITDTDDRSTPMPTDNAGGAIPTGTFYEIEYHAYQGTTVYSPTDVRENALHFDASAGTILIATQNPPSGPKPLVGGAYVTQAQSITLNVTCPSTGTIVFGYTYAGGRLSLYDFTKKTIEVFSTTAPDAGDQSCGSIPNTAPAIAPTYVDSSVPPVGTGGTILDGTYFLTGDVYYGGHSTSTTSEKITVLVAGTSWEVTYQDNTTAPTHLGLLETANGGTGAMSLVATCPQAAFGHDEGITSFTASGGTVHLYKAGAEDQIFTKQ